MRVLQVLPSVASDYGGPVYATVANCRALHLADPSVETTLASTERGLNSGSKAALRRQLPDRAELRVFPATGRGAFTYSVELTRWARSQIRKFDLVVVQTLLNPLSTMMGRLADSANVPYVLVPHGTLSRYTFVHRRRLLKKLYYSVLDSRTLGRASATRFTTTAERDEAARLGSLPAPTVIPHPFHPQAEESEHSAHDGSTVLFLSRLHPKKGLDLLLRAFREVSRAMPNATLTIAGSGSNSYERRVRSMVDGLGLQSVVQFSGFVESREKERLLNRADIFILPSRHENFGIAVVEAMNRGLPVVITRGVEIWPDVARAGAGLVVDGEPSQLSVAIQRLLSDSGERGRMGSAGKQLVRERYSPARIGPQLADFYRSLVGSRTLSANLQA